MNWDEYNIIKPGRIVSFDHPTQLATVRICAERVIANSYDDDQLVDRGVIQDVVVHTVGGGEYLMTFPIEPGDTCLLLFSQVGYDHWMHEDKDTAGQVAGRSAPHLKRRFNQADCLAIVGFNTQPRAFPQFHATNSEWVNRDYTQGMVLYSNGDNGVIAPKIIKNISQDFDVAASRHVDLAGVTATIDYTTSWTIDCPTTTWTGDINLTGDITQTGNLTVTGNGSVTGTFACGALTGSGGGSITGGTTTLSDCTVSGTLTNSGTTFAALIARVAALEATCAPGCSG